MTPNPRVVYIVVGTLAFALIAYAFTLAICALRGVTPPDDVLAAFKDLGIFASGALASLLSRTGQTPEAPIPTTIVNKETDSVPTHEATKTK